MHGGGGARVGGRPPPGKSKTFFFLYMGALLLLFSPYGEPFALMVFFYHVRGLSWAWPPTKISAGAHGWI